MSKLQGKNVLITGASSGIGQAIAVRFAREGANVAINYPSGAQSEMAQAENTQQMARKARTNGGGKEILVQADISREDQVKAMFATVLEAFGSLDVLINNAGIQKACPSHEVEVADFDRVLGVNL